MRKHHELVVWQTAMELTREIYRLTNKFPSAENFGLTSQLRRAAVSIPSNIAEGAGRGTQKEFLHFLYISRGSLCEVETQLSLASDFGYMNISEFPSDLVEKTFSLLGGLINSIKTKISG
jgi:four helix bundle protein